MLLFLLVGTKMRVWFVDGTAAASFFLHCLNHVIKSGVELFGIMGFDEEGSGVKRCLRRQCGAMRLLRVPGDIAFVEVVIDGYSIHL
jgi:hypothetical protein